MVVNSSNNELASCELAASATAKTSNNDESINSNTSPVIRRSMSRMSKELASLMQRHCPLCDDYNTTHPDSQVRVDLINSATDLAGHLNKHHLAASWRQWKDKIETMDVQRCEDCRRFITSNHALNHQRECTGDSRMMSDDDKGDDQLRFDSECEAGDTSASIQPSEPQYTYALYTSGAARSSGQTRD